MAQELLRAMRHYTHGTSYTAALAVEARLVLQNVSKSAFEKQICEDYVLHISQQFRYLGRFEIGALQTILSRNASAMDDVGEEGVSIVVWTLEQLRNMGTTGFIPPQATIGQDGAWRVEDSRAMRVTDCNLLVSADGRHYDFLRKKMVNLNETVINDNNNDNNMEEVGEGEEGGEMFEDEMSNESNDY